MANYFVPSGGDATVVELADGGRRFRKQLVKFGKWVNPNDPTKPMILDREWARSVARNFQDKVLNRVPVVEGHPRGSAELLTSTRGWLEGLAIEEDGLYGDLEIKASDTAKGIDDGLIDDASISFDPDYQDKRTGERVGPALLHVGLVNDPYLKGMAGFQALADSTNAIMLSESKEQQMSVVKNDRDFDVKVTYEVDGETKEAVLAPGQEVEVPEEAQEGVSKQVAEAAKSETDEERAAREAQEAAEAKAAADKEAAEKAAAEEAAAKAAAEGGATAQLEQAKKELSETKAKLAARDAEDAYKTLLDAGMVVPAQREAYLSLSTASVSGPISLADGSTTSLTQLVTEFINAGGKRIAFGEQGAAGGEAKPETPYDALSDEEKARLADLGTSKEEYNKYNGDSISNEDAKPGQGEAQE